MKQGKNAIILILLLAAFLRFYKLGQNPPSLDWDEASLGYNAYSLLKTGKDEYGNSWPISIRSFNDYKPPLYTYFLIPSIAVLGLSEFAIRFPSALAGILTVFATYFFVKKLFSGNKQTTKPWSNEAIASTAALLLAISPWHLQFSRVAFEANLALTFFVFAVLFFLEALKKNSKIWLLLASIGFVATMYSYHSARLIVPLFLVLLAILYRKTLLKMKQAVLLSAILGIILLAPIGLTILRGAAQARFSTVSVFTNPGIYTKEEEKITRQSEYRKEDQGKIVSIFHHPWLVYSQIIAQNYFDHFNLQFLFLEGDGIGRHSAAGMGLLYYWELPFLLTGIYYLVKNKPKANKILFSWLFVSPSASALTTQTPHAVRSLLMVIPLAIISAYGVLHTIKLLEKKNNWKLVFIGLLVLLVFINFMYYLDLYYIHTPIERSQDWQYGYKQLVNKLIPFKETANEIIVTTKYDQPYIFFLFYEGIDPSWYQKVAEQGSNGFGKYIFRKINYEKDIKVINSIIVAAPEEIPKDAAVFDKIQFLDGEDAFLLART
jgi:4-amino-4-deoxy-L-arabinose transferase-like glycosyltransferase